MYIEIVSEAVLNKKVKLFRTESSGAECTQWGWGLGAGSVYPAGSCGTLSLFNINKEYGIWLLALTNILPTRSVFGIS